MKNILYTLLLTLMSLSLHAQLGIRAGVNLATQSFNIDNDDIDIGNVVGYQLGLNYEIDVNDGFSIRPGLLYATKGSSQKFPDLDQDTRLHYFEIPVDLVFDLGIIDLFAGPYMGYSFKGENDINGDVIDIDFDNDNINEYDFGLNIGGNIDINDKIYLGAYYALGLADISDNTDILGNEESIKNRSISVFVTFRL